MNYTMDYVNKEYYRLLLCLRVCNLTYTEYQPQILEQDGRGVMNYVTET